MPTRTRRIVASTVAAITAVLGAASLLLFGLFLWTGAFGILNMRMTENALLSWDAGLCLLFFLQHSGMVRKSFRVRLYRVLPEDWFGVVYTIASAVALLLLVGLWQRSSTDLYAASGAARWLLGTVFLLSLAGFLWGIRSLGGFDAFGIQAFLSPIARDQRHPPKLTIAGPYRFIRHPFYCFGIVALWSAPVLSLDRLLFNALFTAWILLGATLEERDLLEEFGNEYKLYQRAVPMFIPRPAARRRRLAARAQGH